MTTRRHLHIISEVKAEVIRFSPYRLALVGPHKIQKCLIFADACASADFYLRTLMDSGALFGKGGTEPLAPEIIKKIRLRSTMRSGLMLYVSLTKKE